MLPAKSLLVLLICLSLSAPASANPEAPAAPYGLSATPTEAGALLTWTPAPVGAGVDGFRVYRLDDGVFDVVAETSDTEFLDEDGHLEPLPGVGHVYYVSAFNADGESPPSNPSWFKYPYCWTVVEIPGKYGLPAGVTDDCYLPIPIPCIDNLPIMTRDDDPPRIPHSFSRLLC